MSDPSDQRHRYEDLRSDYHSAADPEPDTPPQQQPRDRRNLQADWTTGQGIGFLVALPGWIIVGLAGVVAAFSAGSVLGGDADSSSFLMGAILVAAFGAIGAIPGTIVFYKCRPKDRAA